MSGALIPVATRASVNGVNKLLAKITLLRCGCLNRPQPYITLGPYFPRQYRSSRCGECREANQLVLWPRYPPGAHSNKTHKYKLCIATEENTGTRPRGTKKHKERTKVAKKTRGRRKTKARRQEAQQQQRRNGLCNRWEGKQHTKEKN